MDVVFINEPDVSSSVRLKSSTLQRKSLVVRYVAVQCVATQTAAALREEVAQQCREKAKSLDASA